MKRHFHLLCALLAPVMLLAACGATASPSPTAAVSTTTPVKPAPPSPTASPAAAATSAPTVASHNPAATLDLTILHTNDVRGYLEPCG